MNVTRVSLAALAFLLAPALATAPLIGPVLGPTLGTAAADSRPASKGIYTEAGLGATTFLGTAAGYAQPGPSLEARIGYDLFSWLSVGVHLQASSHEATVPPPPEDEYFQFYGASGDGRLGFRYRSIGAFVDGSLGMTMVSSNILAKVGILDPGETLAVMFRAGGGIEYQLQNRHYAFGLAGQWWLMPDFSALSGTTFRAYLRYTY